jgi:CspA family cold shock protein
MNYKIRHSDRSILSSNGGPDVFVHTSGLVNDIRENDVVTYDVQNGNKGVNAANVKIA